MSGTRHNNSVPPFDAVILVGSQGALQAAQVVLGSLPAGFPAPVIFDLHRRTSHGFTEGILARGCALPVRSATHGLSLERGTLYVAPCDRQLIIRGPRRLCLTDGADTGPGHRFANGLLSSGAEVFGPRLVAVMLSGRLEGGAEGVRAVKRKGGRVLVQAPDSATAPSMPAAALATGCADFALPVESIGPALVALCAAPGAADLFRVRLNAGVRN